MLKITRATLTTYHDDLWWYDTLKRRPPTLHTWFSQKSKCGENEREKVAVKWKTSIICDGTTTLHHSQFNQKLWEMVQLIKVWENQPKHIFPIFSYFLPLHVCMHVTHLISFSKTMACLFKLHSSTLFALPAYKKMVLGFTIQSYHLRLSELHVTFMHFFLF